jgi:hypothetical protein
LVAFQSGLIALIALETEKRVVFCLLSVSFDNTCTVVFGDWALVKATPPPPARRVYHRAHYHWAHAHSLIASSLDNAVLREHLEGFDRARAELQLPENVKRYSADLFPARQLLSILWLWLQAALIKMRAPDGGNQSCACSAVSILLRVVRGLTA